MPKSLKGEVNTKEVIKYNPAHKGSPEDSPFPTNDHQAILIKAN